jgi:hypothetical protein
VSGIFYKASTLFLAVLLCLSVTAWLKGRQDLQTVTAATLSLRKTLGEMAVALTEKDREIDRVTKDSRGPGR